MCRREIEISFKKRIKEVEYRFSGDQESIEKRFQADVLKLEQHYQSELKALSESHVEQKFHWEAQLQEALENAEEQRRMMEDTMEQERENLDRQWKKEWHELESLHEEKMEDLVTKNQQLQNEVDDLICMAQTKEIELSRQLNDLHNRLQESLETRDELLAQSEKKAFETSELLLNRTVEDFKQERAELLSSQSELAAKNKMLSISERQISERIELLTERDDLKMKIEELEMLLQQASTDFELERKELLEDISILEKKLKENLENDREELIAERDVLRNRIKELEFEFSQGLSSAEKARKEESKEMRTLCFVPPEICVINDVIQTDSSNQELVCLMPFLVEQDVDVETITEAPHALDGVAENIKNFDNEYDEMGDGTNPSESEENGQICLTENDDTWPESPQEVEDPEAGCCSAEIGHEDPESTSCNGHNPDSPVTDEKHSNVESKNEAVFPHMPREEVSSLEAFEGADADEGGENEGAPESCEEENKPQDVPASDNESPSHEDGPCHVTVADPSVLEEMDDPDELFLVDVEVTCLSNNSHDHRWEVEHVSDSDCEPLTAKIKDECTHDYLETLDEDADCEDGECSLLKLQVLYNTATEENILLHQKISLLQQKTEILENLLAHNSEKIKTGHQVLEENFSLKVKMLLLLEHVKELEIKALKMTDLQIRYEDCMCENAKLKEQNGELEKRVWSLESGMNIFHGFQNHSKISLVDDIGRMREENGKLSELLGELERQRQILSPGQSVSPTVESLLDLTDQLEVKVQAATDLQGCCEDLEEENTNLRRAITDLQDKSQTLNKTTWAHR